MKCDNCKEKEAMHRITKGDTTANLCCECYVNRGYPPADWHRDCIQAYNKIKASKTP